MPPHKATEIKIMLNTSDSLLRKALKFAEISLEAHLENINNINVFPVADNDTGSNLWRTIKGIADTLDASESNTKQLETYAEGVFLKASGNSGMMFSMFLSYFSAYFMENDKVFDMPTLAKALLSASQQAKHHIDNFVHGTLISYLESVALNLSKPPIMSLSERDFNPLLTLLSQQLLNTSEENPFLKDTALVDAGAMGIHYWLKGFLAGLCGINNELLTSSEAENIATNNKCESIHWETKPEYHYCVQMTLNISEHMQPQLSRDLAEDGDCSLNLFRHGKSRIHIHTNHAKDLFKKIMAYANVLEVKIDNMMMQYQAHQSKGGIAIVTDSSADIPQIILDAHPIHCIPLTITQGDQVMLDGLTIDGSDLPARIKAYPDYPKTASPSLGMIKDTFTWLSKTHEHVIVVALSAKMSATYQAFKTLAQEFSNVSVIDSRTSSGAHGWLVASVAELIAQGMSIDHILEKTHNLIDNIDIFVLLNDCDSMTKSGRFGRAKAWIANTMKLKPIVGINNDGEAILIAKTMSTIKQSDKLFKIMQQKHQEKPIRRFSILHANNHTYAKNLASALEEKLGLKSSGIMPVSSVIQLHAGQGSVAVAIER